MDHFYPTTTPFDALPGVGISAHRALRSVSLCFLFSTAPTGAWRFAVSAFVCAVILCKVLVFSEVQVLTRQLGRSSR
jgi:hypothetical protein